MELLLIRWEILCGITYFIISFNSSIYVNLKVGLQIDLFRSKRVNKNCVTLHNTFTSTCVRTFLLQYPLSTFINHCACIVSLSNKNFLYLMVKLNANKLVRSQFPEKFVTGSIFSNHAPLSFPGEWISLFSLCNHLQSFLILRNISS